MQIAELDRNMDLRSKESEVSSSSGVDTKVEDNTEDMNENDIEDTKPVNTTPLDCSVSPPTNSSSTAVVDNMQESVAKVILMIQQKPLHYFNCFTVAFYEFQMGQRHSIIPTTEQS